MITLDAMQRFPNQTVRSFAWAGMSPGNQAFSDWYIRSLRQTNSRFISTLDIIPQWYANLAAMKRGFANGPVPPIAVKAGIEAMEAYMLLHDISYVATPTPKEFPATLYPSLSWTDQGHAQHEHRYYMFLTGMPVDVIQRRFPPDIGGAPWEPPASPAGGGT